MSVDITASLYYGWRMKKDDIPDCDEHHGAEWEDVFDCDPSSYRVTLNGHETDWYPYELVRRENDYVSSSYYFVGIPLYGNCPVTELNAQLVTASIWAPEVFRRVMGRDCDPETEPPQVWLFERYW